MANTQHIEAKTKWPPFPNIFKCIFLNEKVWSLIDILLKFVPRVKLQYSSTGSDNVLAPTRRQAIIWTNDGQIIDPCLRHSTSMS